MSYRGNEDGTGVPRALNTIRGVLRDLYCQVLLPAVHAEQVPGGGGRVRMSIGEGKLELTGAWADSKDK